jgi:threonine dehydrogenase-like Zn-dependent dehydrogenase
VLFLGDSKLQVNEMPVPEPGPGEALIQIAISAICGSELPSLRRGMWSDQYSNDGHEMAGVVIKANGLRHIREGQRVGLQIMVGCGHCKYCVQGDPKHCVHGMAYLLDGHSEFIVAPEMCIVPLPDDLDWDAGVLLCGDTLGTPYHALKRMGGVNAALVAAVFGCGPIGLGFVTWLKFFGVYTIVSEPDAYRRTLAERLGADLALDPRNADVVPHIRQVTNGGADLCIDCSEAEQTLSDALDAARIHGHVIWVGEKDSCTIKPTEQIIHKELRMTASWYFTVSDFLEEVEFFRRHLPVSQLITHRYSLGEAADAYERFKSGGTGKVVFDYPLQFK